MTSSAEQEGGTDGAVRRAGDERVVTAAGSQCMHGVDQRTQRRAGTASVSIAGKSDRALRQSSRRRQGLGSPWIRRRRNAPSGEEHVVCTRTHERRTICMSFAVGVATRVDVGGEQRADSGVDNFVLMP